MRMRVPISVSDIGRTLRNSGGQEGAMLTCSNTHSQARTPCMVGGHVIGILIAFLVASGGIAGAFQRTEVREPCASHDPLRQPFFGETHLHTGLSFDASIRF